MFLVDVSYSCEFSFQIEVVEEDLDEDDFNSTEVPTQPEPGIDVSFMYGPLLEAVVDLSLQESENFPGSAGPPPPVDSSSSQSNSTVGPNTKHGLVAMYWEEILLKIRILWWTPFELAVIISKLIVELGKRMKDTLINSVRKKESRAQ